MIRKERDGWLFKTDRNLAARRDTITHEAAVMLLRCERAEALRKWMTREKLAQAQAAKRLSVVQLYYKVRPLSL